MSNIWDMVDGTTDAEKKAIVPIDDQYIQWVIAQDLTRNEKGIIIAFAKMEPNFNCWVDKPKDEIRRLLGFKSVSNLDNSLGNLVAAGIFEKRRSVGLSHKYRLIDTRNRKKK